MIFKVPGDITIPKYSIATANVTISLFYFKFAKKYKLAEKKKERKRHCNSKFTDDDSKLVKQKKEGKYFANLYM